MSRVNYPSREICFGFAYAGPERAGRNTTLRAIYSLSPESLSGPFHRRGTKPFPATWFEMLVPDRTADGLGVRVGLFKLPNAGPGMRKKILQAADGVVFVADSRRGRERDNLAAWTNLLSGLGAAGINAGDIPIVIQFNKRDLSKTRKRPVDMISSVKDFQIAGGILDYFGTVAIKWAGVMAPYERLLERVLERHRRSGPRGPKSPQIP